MREAKCGTTSGYARHLRLGEDACAPCLASRAQVTRDRYATDPEFRDRVRARAAAQRRALQRLSHLYPADYAALYAEEKGRS
jgi:hypothetical protein